MIRSISEWQREVYANAKAHGFHDGASPEASIWKALGNIHSEISEAWHEARRPDFNPRVVVRDSSRVVWPEASRAVAGSDDLEDAIKQAAAGRKPEGFAIELADAAIRLFDTAEMFGIDLEAAIAIKHAFNQQRPFRHGDLRA